MYGRKYRCVLIWFAYGLKYPYSPEHVRVSTPVQTRVRQPNKAITNFVSHFIADKAVM